MSESFNLKEIRSSVFTILTDVPKTRDDDRALLVYLWTKETKAKNLFDFLDELLQGELSNAETVTRVRRKLQEKHENLRGEKWDLRHNLEGAMCQQLSLFNSW